MGNKTASYLEAGLPFFYFEELEYLAKLMKGYGLGLCYKGLGHTKELKKFIKKQNYKRLEQKVIKARNDYLMEKHFPRIRKICKKSCKCKGD